MELSEMPMGLETRYCAAYRLLAIYYNKVLEARKGKEEGVVQKRYSQTVARRRHWARCG